MTEGRRLRSLTLVEAPADAFGRSMPSTEELLARGYDRWLAPLHAYVSQFVLAPRVRERIVRQVLSQNLDLLIGRRDAETEISRLHATAIRLIAEVLTGEDVPRSLIGEGAQRSGFTARTRSRPQS